MTASRRDFLKAAGLLAAGYTAASCSPVYRALSQTPGEWGPWPELDPLSFHVLSRLTYGPNLKERERMADLGAAGWVEEQLAIAEGEDTSAMWRVRGLETLDMTADELALRDREAVVDQLIRGTLLRRLYGDHQLYERMVEFWSDHFNIYVHKNDCWFLKVVDDREVIRRHALGSFRDLLWESAHSPAMLVYLDNQANLKGAPNENYARELLELHSLSLKAGYSQSDVMELSRCFTGWTVKDHFWLGEFTFEAGHHEPGDKWVLGNRIPAGGLDEGERLLEILADHPNTAEHLAAKLVRRFVTDHPEAKADLVNKVAGVFRSPSVNLQSVVRILLLDGLVHVGEELDRKFRRPVDFVLSSLRMLHAETGAGPSLQGHLRNMGHLPFHWAMPDGPPDGAPYWEAGLIHRWAFTLDLVGGRLAGTQIDWGHWASLLGGKSPVEWVQGMGSFFLGKPVASDLARQMVESVTGLGIGDDREWLKVLTAGVLSSPAFQWQ